MNDTIPEASADPATVSAAPEKESKGSAIWREIKGLLWVLVAVLLTAALLWVTSRLWNRELRNYAGGMG